MDGKVFLVLEWVLSEGEENPHIEVNGIFTTEEKAKEACLIESYLFGEFELDEVIHEKSVQWPTLNPFPKNNTPSPEPRKNSCFR